MTRRLSAPQVALVYLGLLAFFIFLLVPLLWLLLSSFQQGDALYAKAIVDKFKHFTLSNYHELFSGTSFAFWLYLRNSVIVAVVVTAFSTIIASLAAYALSRFRLRGKQLFLVFSLLPQLLPYVLILIPFYLIMTSLHLTNTLVGIILAHTLIALPFELWMLVGYFNGIPKELDNSAMVDGCSRLGALWRVIMPVALPGVVVAGFYAFVVSWGDFLFVSILSRSQQTATLPLGLETLVGGLQIKWGLIDAAAVIVILPTAVLFAFAQRRLVEGLTAGAVKG